MRQTAGKVDVWMRTKQSLYTGSEGIWGIADLNAGNGVKGERDTGQTVLNYITA